MKTKVTRETLTRDRLRREREARLLAALFDDAADVLERENGHSFYAVIRHLRDEADRWKR